MHPLRRLRSPRVQSFTHPLTELRRRESGAYVASAEKHARQPGIGDPVILWEEGNDHNDSDYNQQYALEKAEDRSCEPVKPSESKQPEDPGEHIADEGYESHHDQSNE